MGPAPVLSDYQAAAQAQYEPQLAADITTSKANTASEISNLESSKGQIGTNYNQAIQSLQNSVQDQTGKIGQLYTSRLLGNTSGLQGNDMGQMFSRANQQQGIIESTRANALNSITTQEANLSNSEIANESALASKYQGLEAAAANTGYDTAQKQYNTDQLTMAKMNQSQANSDRTYNLDVAKLGIAQSKAATAAADKAAAAYGLKQGSQGQYMFHGANGSPVSMAQYLQGAKGSVSAQDMLDLLKNGTSYDKTIYNHVASHQNVLGNDNTKILNYIASLDKNNYYGLQ